MQVHTCTYYKIVQFSVYPEGLLIIKIVSQIIPHILRKKLPSHVETATNLGTGTRQL
jgi:hypothetical protein